MTLPTTCIVQYIYMTCYVSPVYNNTELDRTQNVHRICVYCTLAVLFEHRKRPDQLWEATQPPFQSKRVSLPG